MFRHYLHRVYQNLLSGRKRRAPRRARTSRLPTTHPAVEDLERRELLSCTVGITQGGNGPYLRIECTGITHDTVTLDHGADPIGGYSIVNGGLSRFYDSTYTSIYIAGGTGGITANVQGTPLNRPTDVFVRSLNLTDVVNVGGAQGVQNIRGTLYVHRDTHDGPRRLTLNVNDGPDAASQTGVNFDGTGDAGSIRHLAPGDINFLASDLQALNVTTGKGQNVVTVGSIDAGFPVTLDSAGGTDTVIVDDTHSITGELRVKNTLGLSKLTVKSSMSLPSTYDTWTPPFDLTHSWGRVDGPGPGLITYRNADITSVTAWAGGTVNVRSIRSPLNVLTYGATAVNVGTTAHSVSQIQAALRVSRLSPGDPALATLNVDDAADNEHQVFVQDTVFPTPNDPWGRILGPADSHIYYRYLTTANVTLQTGVALAAVGGTKVDVWATGVPLTLEGHGPTQLTVGNSHTLTGLQADVTVRNTPSYTALTVDDSADGAAHTVFLDQTMIGGAPYGSIAGLAGAGVGTVYYKDTDVNSVTVKTGTGTEVVNVLAAGLLGGNPTNLTTVEGHSVNTTVNVGGGNTLTGIAGPLMISNPPSFSHVNINDSADSSAHPNVVLTATSLTGITSSVNGTISFGPHDLADLTIRGGSGTTAYTVVNTQASGPTGASLTTLYTGGGAADSVNVQGTTGPLTVNAAGLANDVVNVGNAGKLSGIQGTLTLNNPTSWSHVNLNDSNDMNDHPNVMLTATSLANLANATISFGADSLAGLTITGGSGATTYTIADTQASTAPGGNLTTLNTGTGADTVNIQGTTGVLTVNAGRAIGDVVNIGNAGSLTAIQAAVTLNNGPGWTLVNIYDSADISSHPNVALTDTSLANLANATISFGANSLAGLTIIGGSGSNTYNILNTQVSAVPGGNLTELSTGSGADTVYVRGAAAALAIDSGGVSGPDAILLGDAANTLAGITAPVSISAAAADTLSINDQGTSADRTYIVGAATVSWSGGTGTVSYLGLGSLTVHGGSGNDTYSLTSTSASAALIVAAGTGNNTAVGSDAGNVWALAGINGGVLSGPAYASPVTFANVGNLTAGAGGDYFRFADGARITDNLAGGGADALDYSAYSTSVVVDLQLATPGADTGVGGTVSGIAAVYGGAAAPAGSGVYNLLIGSGGNVLTGGTGRRNILVAGGSASTLNSGDQEDLLIAGSTSYDSDPALAAWSQIAAEWASSDDFATRVLKLGTGNGVPLLDATTVFGNGGGNTLNGTGALTWIFSDGMDNINNFDSNSPVVPING